MSNGPPTLDQADLADAADVCCCGCARCDFDIGTIVFDISGTYSYTAEYEDPGDPGFWNVETLSFSWNAIGTFTQIPRTSPTNPLSGEFIWHNNRFENTNADNRCDCDTLAAGGGLKRGWVEISDATGTPVYHVRDLVVNVRHLITDRATPAIILLDENRDITVSVFINQPAAGEEGFFYDDAAQAWRAEVGISWQWDSGSFQGPPFPDAPPAFGSVLGWMVLDSDTTGPPCGHPHGEYTGSGDDSDTLGATGEDVYYDQSHSVTGTITVNGSGGTTLCAAAPEDFVSNDLYSFAAEDGSRWKRQDGGIYLRQ